MRKNHASQYANFGSLLDDEYVIQDISLTRKYYSLFIEKDDQQIVYRISLETYSFLKNLSVFEEVVVCKHNQQLCIEWPWLGYIIPISEFECIKTDIHTT